MRIFNPHLHKSITHPNAKEKKIIAKYCSVVFNINAIIEIHQAKASDVAQDISSSGLHHTGVLLVEKH